MLQFFGSFELLLLLLIMMIVIIVKINGNSLTVFCLSNNDFFSMLSSADHSRVILLCRNEAPSEC